MHLRHVFLVAFSVVERLRTQMTAVHVRQIRVHQSDVILQSRLIGVDFTTVRTVATLGAMVRLYFHVPGRQSYIFGQHNL